MIVSTDTTDKGTTPFYGLGVDYRLAPQISVRSQLKRFEFDRDTSYLASVTLMFDLL